MRGMQKSKRVQWASDVNLCQVRLFLSEESPSQVGSGVQDHLQAKVSWPLHPNGVALDDHSPPGFEGTQPAGLLKNKLSQIPVIAWRCPPRVVLDLNWRVAAGGESEEVEVQNEREMRVLEAIYPRPSAIPPNPSPLLGSEDSPPSDDQIPLIPINPYEEEDVAEDALSDSMTQSASANSQSYFPVTGAPLSHSGLIPSIHANQIPLSGVESVDQPDAVAAARAALSTIMSNGNQEGLIDHDLLMRILSDPSMLDQLVTNHGVSSSTRNVPPMSLQTRPVISVQNVPDTSRQGPSMQKPDTSMQNMPATAVQSMPMINGQNMPRPRSAGLRISEPPLVSNNRVEPPLMHAARTDVVAPAMGPTASGPFYPPPIRGGPVSALRPPLPDVSAPSSSAGPPVIKDINYYKSLIQQHGEEKQEALPRPPEHIHSWSGRPFSSIQEPVNNSNTNTRSRDSRPKVMKPCIYFNSARGCRNGANCAYQHDPSIQQRVSGVPDVQSAKRMKMDREISGA